MPAMKTIIYARVSTDKQSHASQLAELREYCARRRWRDVEEITDTVSGAKPSREGLDRLMALIRRGKVDAVVCYKLDRLGRSLSHLAQIIDELTANKVALVVPGQGIDTSASNPAATLQLNILCAVAQFEREVIRERVNAGLAVARANGVKLGRPAHLQEHRAHVAKLSAKGLSGRKIAERLGIPSSSVFKVLSSLQQKPARKAA
jgi:DNA invertase Pin-like site-specific DNA recombinase